MGVYIELAEIVDNWIWDLLRRIIIDIRKKMIKKKRILDDDESSSVKEI